MQYLRGARCLEGSPAFFWSRPITNLLLGPYAGPNRLPKIYFIENNFAFLFEKILTYLFLDWCEVGNIRLMTILLHLLLTP